jgi:hypothetical protein
MPSYRVCFIVFRNGAPLALRDFGHLLSLAPMYEYGTPGGRLPFMQIRI